MAVLGLDRAAHLDEQTQGVLDVEVACERHVPGQFDIPIAVGESENIRQDGATIRPGQDEQAKTLPRTRRAIHPRSLTPRHIPTIAFGGLVDAPSHAR